jgi:hypothetical protein
LIEPSAKRHGRSPFFRSPRIVSWRFSIVDAAQAAPSNPRLVQIDRAESKVVIIDQMCQTPKQK